MERRVVAVTGGSGYLGRHLNDLLKDAYTVVNLSRSPDPSDETVRVLDIARSSIADIAEALVSNGNPVDTIVHLGGLSRVPQAYSREHMFMSANALTTRKLLEAAALTGIRQFVYTSSVTVHGNPAGPLGENSPIDPLNHYSASKAAAEYYLHSGSAGGLGIGASILRLTNLIGASHYARNSSGVTGYIAQQVKQGNAVSIAAGYATVDGTPERDYLDVRDAASLILATIEKPTNPGSVRIYLAGTGISTSTAQLATHIMEVAGRKIPIEFGPRREGDADRVVVDSSRARKELDWKPLWSLTDSLQSELDHA